MSESEIEEYIIDTKEGKNHFNLRVSLYDDRVKLLITTAEVIILIDLIQQLIIFYHILKILKIIFLLMKRIPPQ